MCLGFLFPLAVTLEWVRPPVCASVFVMFVCVCGRSLPGDSELYDRGSLGGEWCWVPAGRARDWALSECEVTSNFIADNHLGSVELIFF